MLLCKQSLEAIVTELDDFYCNTSLKVNYDKTVIYPVGAARNKNCKMKLSKPMKWSKEKIDVLRILINVNDLNEVEGESFTDTIIKAENIMKMWVNRHTSLQGKIVLVNSLVASLFVYKMQILSTHRYCSIK